MVQPNTESIHLWSCAAQWPYSQITVRKVRQSMSDFYQELTDSHQAYFYAVLFIWLMP